MTRSLTQKAPRTPWNKGLHVGYKLPYPPQSIQAHYRRLCAPGREWECMIFCVAIDSMLRSCDLLRLFLDYIRVRVKPNAFVNRVTVVQQKTGNPVTIHLTPPTLNAIKRYLNAYPDHQSYWLFPGRRSGHHMSYATLHRMVKKWTREMGLPEHLYGVHSLRRSKPNFLRAQGARTEAVQYLLGHESIWSTDAYLHILEQEALSLAEHYSLLDGKELPTPTPPHLLGPSVGMDALLSLYAGNGYDQRALIAAASPYTTSKLVVRTFDNPLLGLLIQELDESSLESLLTQNSTMQLR